MSINDPQFYYMFLILPFLFGITLIGEVIYKLSKEEWNGLINFVIGLFCIAFVVVAYYMFTSFLPKFTS